MVIFNQILATFQILPAETVYYLVIQFITWKFPNPICQSFGPYTYVAGYVCYTSVHIYTNLWIYCGILIISYYVPIRPGKFFNISPLCTLSLQLGKQYQWHKHFHMSAYNYTYVITLARLHAYFVWYSVYVNRPA